MTKDQEATLAELRQDGARPRAAPRRQRGAGAMRSWLHCRWRPHRSGTGDGCSSRGSRRGHDRAFGSPAERRLAQHLASLPPFMLGKCSGRWRRAGRCGRDRPGPKCGPSWTRTQIASRTRMCVRWQNVRPGTHWLVSMGEFEQAVTAGHGSRGARRLRMGIPAWGRLVGTVVQPARSPATGQFEQFVEPHRGRSKRFPMATQSLHSSMRQPDGLKKLSESCRTGSWQRLRIGEATNGPTGRRV